VGARKFSDNGAQVMTGPAVSDPLGHGTAVIQAIWAQRDCAELLIAQVFDERGVTTAATIAAALEWSVLAGAGLIHMSLGLREDRHVLAAAIAAAASAGCIIVASAPARGPCTFPARYPNVIRGTGDARCAPGEISVLASAQADFGGCTRLARQPEGPLAASTVQPAGASLGAAHITGFILEHVLPGSAPEQVRVRLTSMAHYRGVERRAAHMPRSASSASTSPCSPTAFVVNPGTAGPNPLPEG
jgi:hypothetical protein